MTDLIEFILENVEQFLKFIAGLIVVCILLYLWDHTYTNIINFIIGLICIALPIAFLWGVYHFMKKKTETHHH